MGFGIGIVLLLLIVIGVGWRLSDLVICPKTRSIADSYDYQVAEGHLVPEDFAALPKEEVRIRSPFGYDLFGLYIPYPGANKTVIIAHGITATLYHAVKYLWPFRDLGFNALLIEHRNHGRSGGTNTTFGYYEKEDLNAWVDFLKSTYGDEMLVGAHGESMGAAIALQHAILDPRIAFVVADCPFADAGEEFTYRLKEDYHLPRFPVIPFISFITKLRTGFAFRKAAPIKGMPTLATPVFFIHGEDDTYIPPEASVRLYEAKREPKKLWLVPGAGHAESQPTQPDAYARLVGEFLEEQRIITASR